MNYPKHNEEKAFCEQVCTRAKALGFTIRKGFKMDGIRIEFLQWRSPTTMFAPCAGDPSPRGALVIACATLAEHWRLEAEGHSSPQSRKQTNPFAGYEKMEEILKMFRKSHKDKWTI